MNYPISSFINYKNLRPKFASLVALALLPLVSAASAATLTVTKTADTNDGVCDADCSLREAIAVAAAGDTITFAVTGTVTLDPTLGQLLITKNLTVQGPGAAQLAIDGNNAVRVLRISGANLNVTLSGLTITHGSAPDSVGGGGGILNDSAAASTSTGTVTLDACTITANKATHSSGSYNFGGGIYNASYGTLVINNSTVSSNSVTGAGVLSYGGGVYHYKGTLRLVNTTVSGNTLTATASRGGGVYLDSGTTAFITGGTVLTQNVATGKQNFGGGIYNGGGTLTISNATISNNSLNTTTSVNGYTWGGGINNGGPLTMTDSTVSGNTAGGIGGPEGGGIYNGTGSSQVTSITNCTISGNSTASAAVRAGFDFPPDGFGGGIFNQTGIITISGSTLTNNLVQSNGSSSGGAIYNSPGQTINITNSTFSGNQALSTNQPYSFQMQGGAIYSFGGSGNRSVLNIVGSTFSGNSSIAGATPAIGGAIFADGATVNIRSSTFSGNKATSDRVDASAEATGGAIAMNSCTVTINNSTLGNNTVGSTTSGTSGVIVQGGGIYEYGTSPILNLNNSTVAGNAAGSSADQGNGGGVFVSAGAANVKNTIIATNTAITSEPDVHGAFVSTGYNLIGNSDGSTGFVNGTNGDQVGTTVSPVNPKLAALGSYNGPTQTFALFAGSPAINAGDPNFAASTFTPALTTDQRGMARVRGGRLDIGAYEAAPPPVITAPSNNARTNATPLFTATTEPFDTVIFTITGGSSPVTVTRIADSSGNVSGNSSALAEGTYAVTAVAELFSELPSGPSNARSFVVDATPPVISNVPANITVEATGPSGAVVTYSSPTANDNIDGSVPVTCSPSSGATFALGTTMVTCSASDQAGNAARATFDVTVRDTTPPTISNVPANMTVEATGPSGAVVTFSSPTATDAVSGNVAVTCTPASGSTFALGAATVTCSARDSAGNRASATFTINVRDTTPPALSNVPANVTTTATGPDGATVTYTPPTASDAVSGNVAVNCSPASGSKFPIGTTSVTCSATDAAGNTGRATFSVTVQAATPTPTPTATPAQPVNISTRVIVGTGDNVMIGGFIITGNAPKKVIVRGIGPSSGLSGALADPVLELHGPSGFTTIKNDNWQDTQKAEIEASGLAPKNTLEAAIIATLQPGNYTGIVSGKASATGFALVEVYDLEFAVSSELANISTRGFAQSGDGVMIGGFILGGNPGTNVNVVIRAIGPSLQEFGITNPLPDPTLEIRNSDGVKVSANDNWQDDASQASKLSGYGLAPKNALESAVAPSLPPGAYTALVSGKPGTGSSGIALVEIYHVK